MHQSKIRDTKVKSKGQNHKVNVKVKALYKKITSLPFTFHKVYLYFDDRCFENSML